MITSLDDFLIFFDENTDENTIFEIKNQNEKIISFDVNSHHILSEKNIKHDLIENYFSNDEISLIENFSLNFAQTWYKENDFKKILVFDGLYLGKIVETPLYLFMIQKLKKIFGIKKILENKTPKQISANKDLILIVQELDTENIITKKDVNRIRFTNFIFSTPEVHKIINSLSFLCFTIKTIIVTVRTNFNYRHSSFSYPIICNCLI